MNPSISVVDAIRSNVRGRSAEVTYEFLAGNGATQSKVSLQEFDERARAVAVLLRERVSPGARVLILYPPGEEFIVGFLGVLYAGMVAVPVYPPDPMRMARTLPRLRAVVRNSGADIVLSVGMLEELTSALHDQAPELARLPWINTEEMTLEAAGEWHAPALGHDSIALLQYTSGSTGTPRGVIVTHGNLLSNARAITSNFGATSADISVSWLPFYHDMGLLGGVLQPMLVGMRNILISPLDFLRRPMCWLEAITAHGATVSGGPTLLRGQPERRASLSRR